MKILAASISILTLAGCASMPDSISAAEALSAPDDYVDVPIWITGEPNAGLYTTAAGCPDPTQPCNNVVGPFTYGASIDDGIVIVPSETWSYPEAVGVRPLEGCYDDYCYGVSIGCHGNNLEVVCAPAVPARILAFHGVLSRVGERFEFTADDVELAEGPLEQDGGGWMPHMTE